MIKVEVHFKSGRYLDANFLDCDSIEDARLWLCKQYAIETTVDGKPFSGKFIAIGDGAIINLDAIEYLSKKKETLEDLTEHQKKK